jgi:outer membrane protein OmpA-like peptidoglycan-associated protein
MSLIKKLILLLIFFLVLNVFSIFEFDYKSYLSDNESLSTLTSKNDEKDFLNQLNDLKNRVFNSFEDDEKEVKSLNLELVKKDGLIEMNGSFANENDAKKIADILNINREGIYQYNTNSLIEESLLDDLVLLVTPLKDYFTDNSKLSVVNNQVFLSGQLTDPSYKDLLDSILSRVKIDLRTDINLPEAPLTQADKVINEIEKVVDSKEVKVEKTNTSLSVNKTANPASKKNDVQSTINKLLASKKINFERRSTKITEDSNIVVNEIAKILNENPNFKIEIAGHTDSRGSDSLNKQISQDRASSVREVLISLGIDKNRVTAVGYGEEFPIAQDDENGLSEINRRVEFNILGE